MNFKARIPKFGTIARDVSQLATSSIGAQLVFLVSLPLITQAIPPATFGLYASLMSYATIFAFSAAFKYENAFFVTRSEVSRVNLMLLVLSMCFLNACIGTALFVAAFAPLLGLPRTDGIYVFLIIQGQSLVVSFIAYSANSGAFGNMSRTRFLRTLVTVAGWGIGLWVLQENRHLALYFGAIAGAWFAAWRLASPGLRYLQKSRAQLRLRRIRNLAWAYRRYPVFEAPSRFLTLISQNGLVMISAIVFGPAVAGLVGISNLSITKPLSVLVQSLGRVSQNRYAKALRNRNYNNAAKIVRHTFLFLVGAAVLLSLMLFFGAELVTNLLLGDRWGELPAVLVTFVPRLLGIMVVRPMQMLLSIRGDQIIILFQETTGMLASFGGFAIGYAIFGSLIDSLWVSSIAVFLVYGVFGVWLWVKLQTVPLKLAATTAGVKEDY